MWDLIILTTINLVLLIMSDCFCLLLLFEHVIILGFIYIFFLVLRFSRFSIVSAVMFRF